MGGGFFNELSRDLQDSFPNSTGFSITNLKYMKRFYSFYNQEDTIRQQPVDELQNILFRIPWGHHICIFTKCSNPEQAVFYIQKTLANNWSRSVLLNMIDADLYEAQGKALTNFSQILPDTQGDLAQQITKDPYVFDFLTLTEGYQEKELEDA